MYEYMLHLAETLNPKPSESARPTDTLNPNYSETIDAAVAGWVSWSPEMSRLHVSRINEGLRQLEDVTDVSSRTRSLSLHCNNLRTLSGLEKFTSLRDVVVSNNCLIWLGSLRGLSQLTRLNLSSNNLHDVHQISSLINLQTLDLSRNELQSLHDFAGDGHLCCLSKLDISHNCIDLVPQLGCLVHLLGLKQLNAHSQHIWGRNCADSRGSDSAAMQALPKASIFSLIH